MKRKAIFFDRDGTLIIDKVYLNDVEQIEYLPGVFTALKRLQDAGFVFIVVTNQSGIARGIVDPKNLELIHQKIQSDFNKNEINFAGFYFAPFSVESNHHNRKPNPGMLEIASQEHNIDLSQSWMVGDRMTDVEAGHRAGTRTVLLSGVDHPEKSQFEKPFAFVPDILTVSKVILEAPARR